MIPVTSTRNMFSLSYHKTSFLQNSIGSKIVDVYEAMSWFTTKRIALLNSHLHLTQTVEP